MNNSSTLFLNAIKDEEILNTVKDEEILNIVQRLKKIRSTDSFNIDTALIKSEHKSCTGPCIDIFSYIFKNIYLSCCVYMFNQSIHTVYSN